MSDDLRDLIAEAAEILEKPQTWSQEFYDAWLALEESARRLNEVRDA